MPTAFIGIGIPGSGKTKFLNQLADAPNTVYVCPDDIRFKLYGDAAIQTNPKKVFALAYASITEALIAGCDVIIDATHAKAHDRIGMVRHCQQFTRKIVGIWLITPYELCLARNNARSRTVPEIKVNEMSEMLKTCPPSIDEGFSEILKVDASI